MFSERIPFPFARVGDFGLEKMVFLCGYWSMGLRLGFFYAGLGVGHLLVSSCGSWIGFFVGLRVEA